MRDYFNKPFHHFSPLDGKVPEYHSYEFEYIAAKARRILKGRSRKEIDFGMKTLNWIMSNAERDFDRVYRFSLETEEEQNVRLQEPAAIRNHPSTATWLLNSIGKYDISNQYEFPNAIHAEYFALLALALIDVTCLMGFSKKPKKIPIEKELSNSKMVSLWAFGAMEAISFAEMFYLNKTDEAANEKAKKLISLQKSAAAIKRHSPANEIKVKFLKFYRPNKFPSLAEGVRRFFKTLSDKDKSLLHPDSNGRERFFRQARKDFESGKIKI